MATKKYLSLDRLTEYDALIKAEIDEKINANKTVVDTALSSTSTNPVQNKVIDAEFEAVSTAMNVLEQAIDGKANSSHSHDDAYYTKSEMNAKLDEKANFSHTHTVANITDLTATATELNYMDGVTSNVQEQLDTLTSNKVNKSGDTMTGDLTIKADFGSVRFNDADGNKMSVLQASNNDHTTSIYAYPTDKSTYYERYDLPTPSTGRTSNKAYRILTSKDVTASVAELNFVEGVTHSVQTQLDDKLSLDGGTMTGALTTTALTVSGNSPTITFNETDSKNSSHIVNGNRHYLRSIASDTTYYEQFRTPTPSTGLTGNKSYDFLTTKSAVTIEQGGTGATTATAALTALGAASATPSITSMSNTYHYAHFAKIGKLVICTILPKITTTNNLISSATITNIASAYRPSANKTFTFFSEQAKSGGDTSGKATISIGTNGTMTFGATYQATVHEFSRTIFWMTA